MGFLTGKRALITGVASNRSIAYGIAEAMHREGAELAFTYQNDKLKGRVEKFASALQSSIVIPCDVETDESIEDTFATLKEHWDSVDIVIHAIAFAPKEQLKGSIVDMTTRDGSRTAHEISAYSFLAMARYARPLLSQNSALLSLSYLGAVATVPNYNIMGMAKASLEAAIRYMANDLGASGTRVNGISAGPIRTLASAGIGDFREMLNHVEQNAPLRRNVTIEEVGNAAAFLCSDLASGITGEITYVDAGYSTLGMSGYGIDN